jgi:hypothetical protein
MKRSFNELVLQWLEAQADRRVDPEWEDSAFSGGPKSLAFPATKIPKADLEEMFLKAFGRKATRGFNGQGDIETALSGVHTGSLKFKDMSTGGGLYLLVFEEGIRYYLNTGRNPSMYWSAVKDREGAIIWEPPGGWQHGSHTWSKLYPKGWQPKP